MDDDRTMMVRYREWARQPKVIVTVIAVMSVLFIGYWFETDWFVMKLVIPVGLACCWWEVFDRWKAARRRD